MVPEAPLERTENGAYPAGEGWFVVNVRDTQWWGKGGLGFYAPFEGKEARFAELGINIGILRPGEPGCLYHREEAQEDFLVLSGECLLIVEGQERMLRAWDFVHCPPWTEHGLRRLRRPALRPAGCWRARGKAWPRLPSRHSATAPASRPRRAMVRRRTRASVRTGRFRARPSSREA